jgi:hypothetical protein
LIHLDSLFEFVWICLGFCSLGSVSIERFRLRNACGNIRILQPTDSCFWASAILRQNLD